MSQELATIADAVNDLNEDRVAVYSSFKADDFETRKVVLAATTNAVPLVDHLNEHIALANVVVQAIQITDEKTGETDDAARTILIAEDGKAYAAVSGGIFRALTNIFGIVGQPHTWDKPLDIEVVQERGRRGFNYFTIKLLELDSVKPGKAAA